MKNFWNERYGQKMYSYGRAPNAFFAQKLIHLPKGKILFPAEGEGRNAVYAAIKGWNVKAFDYSEEGRRKALELAKSYDVSIDYDLIDASDFQVTEQYDVIALIFAHFAGEERRQLFLKLVQSLAPGGYLIMEVFSKSQIGRASGGPKDPELLYSKAEMLSLLTDLDFLILEETRIELDEGLFHQGDAAVIRVLAQKK